MFKNFFACKIVVAANQRYPGNIQRLFRLQNCRSRKSLISWKYSKTFRLQICLSRKSSISWKYSKTFSPAKLSQPQSIYNLENFKDFFACKIVLAATHHNSEIVQKLFRLQNCRSRKSAISWKRSKIFPPAKMSQPQTICILETFKDFFGCKNVLVATHRNSQNNQRLFRLQNCLRRKTTLSCKISKTFSPAKLSQQQPIIILKLFKNFFDCKIVVAANQRYAGNIQRLFRVQNVLVATHHNSENFQRLFCLQKCLSRKPSVSWKYSKTFSAAKMSQQQPICILEFFKDFFACKIVLAATHHISENVQKLFRLQNCLSRKSAIYWKYSKIFPPAKLSQQQTINILKSFKDFFACKNVLAANHLYPGKIQRLFRLHSCPRRKSSISWKSSKTFSPAKNSQQQPIIILKKFKDLFACKIVLAANHRYPGNIQRLFRLQICLSRKSSISWKDSKISSPATLSQPQIIDILEIFKDFFACKIVLAKNHRYPGNIQRLFRLQICLSLKSSISWKYSKIFSPANLSQPEIFDILEIFQDFFACKIVVAATHQYINILKMFKNFFDCKIVVAANQRYAGNIQRFFRLQNCLSSNPSIF